MLHSDSLWWLVGLIALIGVGIAVLRRELSKLGANSVAAGEAAAWRRAVGDADAKAEGVADAAHASEQLRLRELRRQLRRAATKHALASEFEKRRRG